MEPDIALKVIQNAFDLWFAPELDRRIAAGQLPVGFKVWAAQVVLDPDADQPRIYFNEQVRGVMQGRANRPIKKGEVVRLADFDEIVALELSSEDPDAGHLTAILHNDAWFLHFDFRYNAGRIDEYLALARQFLVAAGKARQDVADRVTIENLHAAVELLARCFLLLFPGREAVEARTHSFTHSKFNLYGRTGAAPPGHVALLNRLAALRVPARYLRGALDLEEGELDSLLSQAHAMAVELDARRPSPRRPLEHPRRKE